MTATDAEAKAAIWAAVDALTFPSKVKVERDDGTVTYAEVPSLWRQAMVALYGAGEPGNGGGSVAARERSVMDLDLLEVSTLIRTTVTNELGKRAEVMPPGMPAALRRLASVVTAEEADQLWWWEYRFTSWARLLTAYLRVGEHRPAPVRLRNAACPQCGARCVSIENGDGATVVPALVIDFAHGLVQAARCSSCAATWWRGEELEDLARLLG